MLHGLNFGTVPVGSTGPVLDAVLRFQYGWQRYHRVRADPGRPGLDFTDAATGTCDTNGTGHTYNPGDSCT